MSDHLQLLKGYWFNFFSKQGIGKTLLIWLVLFSTLVTVILSGIQLYIDYQLELEAINTRLDEVDSAYKGSIEASLWDVDLEQLDIQLEGLLRLPDVQMVAIEEKQDIDEAIYITKGESNDVSVRRSYKLIYIDGVETIHIGELRIEVSLKAVYRRLLNKALTIMLVQGVKTFFVSLFILYLFYRLVTRHIISIENSLKYIDFNQPFSELKLRRKKKDFNDELDSLVGAYTAMSVNLQKAYLDLKQANKELENDVIARKKAEAEVKLLNEELEYRVEQRTAELEAANKELNAFCYSVSHDLRAPVRRIEGFRHNFESNYIDKLDKQGKHYLTRIAACVKEMNGMIDSFLTLSKSTTIELSLSRVNLSIIAKRVIAKLQEKDDYRQVQIEIDDGISAYSDSRLAELLMTNLLENAWKYTSKTPLAYIRFYAEMINGEKVYIVEDNGAGFDMSFAKNLFTPFTRLHTTEDFPGIGIGLATVKRIVARHGGHVWAESTVDKGAKFFFTLKDKEVGPGFINS